MYFEVSWVCTSLISSGHLPLIFLEEAVLCTSPHHFFAQECSFSGISNALMKFITIDPSCPIFWSAVFSHVEWSSVVVCSMQCRCHWSIPLFFSSLFSFSIFSTGGFLRVCWVGYWCFEGIFGSVSGSLFGILGSVRLHKILGNQKYGWGVHTPLEMIFATTLMITIDPSCPIFWSAGFYHVGRFISV